jgi:stage V sporulation protein B
MKQRAFLHGTLILIVAGFLTKGLGFIPNMLLPRIIGVEGVGLYRQVFPLLILMITLCTAGLPIALAKLVSENREEESAIRNRDYLMLSLIIVIGLSLAISLFIILLAPHLSIFFFSDYRSYPSLLVIVPSIPIIAAAAILRSYFQGKQQMKIPAISSIVETAGRVIFSLLLAQMLLPYGLQYAAAGVMGGVLIGELIGLLLILLYLRRKGKASPFIASQLQIRKMLLSLKGLALPVTLTRLIGSFFYAIEPIVVNKALAISGLTLATATALYGELAGLAIPLILLPTFLTHALSQSLIPAISEAASKGHFLTIRYRIAQATRLTLVICLPFAIFAYSFSTELCKLLYDHPQAGILLKQLAPLSLLLYLQYSLNAALQGLGLVKEAMYSTIIGSIVKTGAILLFASQAELNINGVIIALNMGMLLVTLLHWFSLKKAIKLTLDPLFIVKVIAISVLLSLLSTHLYSAIFSDFYPLIRLALSICSVLFIYLALLRALHLITQEDLKKVPYIGKYLSPLFPAK